MDKYRRTIITLDDTTTGKDYMLFCVFEKLWPDMQHNNNNIHHLHKNVGKLNRFDVGIHVDEVPIQENVVDDPLPHVKLQNNVEMMWGNMLRDPDFGTNGFLLKNGHEDIDSVTEMLPQSQTIQQVWVWYDVQRKMFNFLEENNIKLKEIGTYTNKILGLDFNKHPLHIGCIYVIHYSPIKAVHIETVPMIPAVRCEIDWREQAKIEDVFVKVTERVTDKKSIPNTFIEQAKNGNKFALVHMSSNPIRIDIDIKNGKGDILYFLKNVMFFSLDTNKEYGKNEKLKTKALGQKKIGFEHYMRPAILEKEALMHRQRMEFVFFDGEPKNKKNNKKEAKDCVKRIIMNAKEKIIIADPYFSRQQFDEYIAHQEDKQKEYIIINCQEQLKDMAKSQNKTPQEMVDDIKQSICSFNNSKESKVAFYMLLGQGRLHDRFILTESEGWLLGSSLGEFGIRACCIIKLTDSAHMKLIELLSQWCDNRDISDKLE